MDSTTVLDPPAAPSEAASTFSPEVPSDLATFLDAVESAPGDAWSGIQAALRAIGCIVSVKVVPAKGPVSLPPPKAVSKRKEAILWIKRRRKLLSMLSKQTLIIGDPAGRPAEHWKHWLQRAAVLQLQRGVQGAGLICYAPDVEVDGGWYWIKVGTERPFPYQLQHSYTGKLYKRVSHKDGPEIPQEHRRRIERLVEWEDVTKIFWELILEYPTRGPYPFSQHINFNLPKRVISLTRALKRGVTLYPMSQRTVTNRKGEKSTMDGVEVLSIVAQGSERREFDSLNPEDNVPHSTSALFQDPEGLWERLLNLAADDAAVADFDSERLTAERKRDILAMTRDALYQTPSSGQTAKDHRSWLAGINAKIAHALGISAWTVRRVRREVFKRLAAEEKERDPDELALSDDALRAWAGQATIPLNSRRPCVKCGGLMRQEIAVATCINCGALGGLVLKRSEQRERMRFQMKVDRALAPKFHYARMISQDTRLGIKDVQKEITRILSHVDRSNVQTGDSGRSYE